MKRALLGVLMVTWIPFGCAGSTESAPPPMSPPAPAPAPMPTPEPVVPPPVSYTHLTLPTSDLV